MEELKPCPLCGGEAKFGINKSCCGKTVRIDCTNPQCGANINAYSSKAEAAKVWNRRPASEITGETSDGYHTFNELYHHRAVLFSVICNSRSELAWKSRKHHDGTMYDGMFIVGIDTPQGQATYHYDIDPYWDMFRVPEIPNAPEWDGYTPTQSIERIASLGTTPENKPLTNADRIRKMTDTELATFISEGWNHADYEDGDYDPAFMKWLQSKPEEE